MTRRPRKRARKKTTSRGRGIVTILLVLLLGFFVASIYLGQVRERPATSPMRGAVADLPPPIVPGPESPKVVIWNGCGRDGLGGKVERLLRRSGIDVYETRNADRSDYPHTLVIGRSSREKAAQEVAAFLERTVGVGLYITERAKVPEADVLLILGSDFPDSVPVGPQGAVAPER